MAAHPPEERGRKRKAGPEGGGGTPKSFKVRPVQFSSHECTREACAAAPSRSGVLAMDARPRAVLMRVLTLRPSGAGGRLRYTDGCDRSTACEHCKQAPRILAWHHKCCRDSLLQPGVNVPREMPERPPNPFMLFCRDIKDEVCRHPTIPPYCVVLYSS